MQFFDGLAAAGGERIVGGQLAEAAGGGADQPRTKVAVMLGYGQGQNTWSARYERGEVRDPSPYCYHLAANEFEQRWSVDRREGPVSSTWRRAVLWVTGTDLVHVWRNRLLLDWADVVWTHTEKEHLAVALLLLRFWGRDRRRPEVLAQTIWLWDRWNHLDPLRAHIYTRLISALKLEVTHSTANRTIAEDQVRGRSVVRVAFGASGPSSSPRPEGGYVLAIGNDRHRDWGLLAAVAKRLPEVEFVVASTTRPADKQQWPSNVRRVYPTDFAAVDELYRGASLVVIPLKANAHASGATVVIESAHANRPILATNTGGISDYVAALRGELASLDDADAFATKVESALRHPPPDPCPPGRVGLTAADYVSRYAWLTHLLLGEHERDERVGGAQDTGCSDENR